MIKLRSSLAALGAILLTEPLQAGTFDFMVGGFQITASTPKSTGKISNLGIYRLGYSHPFMRHFSLGISYSLVMSSVVGGDLGYGLDVSFNWFPITRNGRVTARTADSEFAIVELWRPYVGISFNQRQFQSIQSGYAGFGVHLGCERSLTQAFSAKAEARYLRLSGPSQGAVTELDGYAGLAVAF